MWITIPLKKECRLKNLLVNKNRWIRQKLNKNCFQSSINENVNLIWYFLSRELYISFHPTGLFIIGHTCPNQHNSKRVYVSIKPNFFFLSIDNFLRRFYPTSLISPFGIIAKEDFCTPSPPPPPSSKILQKIGKNSYDIHKPSRVRRNQNFSFSAVKSSKKWWFYLKK